MSNINNYVPDDVYVHSHQSFGGGVPIWRHQPKYRMVGGLLTSTFQKGELLHAASPVFYDEKLHVAKILKCFKITAVATSGSNTLITVSNKFSTPSMYVGMNVMVAPSTIAGTGKGALVTAVDSTSVANSYVITVVTSAIDTPVVGGFIVEAASAGGAVAMYCAPSTLLANDLLIGDQNTVSIVSKEPLSLYRNSMPDLPDVVLDNILKTNPLIEFEYLPEL